MQTSPCGGRWREREAGQSDGSAAAPLCWCDLPLHFKSSQEAGTGRHQAGQGMHHKAAWVAAGRGGWRAGAPAGGTSSPAVRGLLLLLAAPGQDGQEEVTLRAKTTTQAAATFPSQDRSPFVSEHTGVCTFQGPRPFTSVAPAPVSGEPPPRKVHQLPAKPLPEAALDERARPLPLVLARGPGSPTAAVFGKQLPVWFSICNLVSASKGLQTAVARTSLQEPPAHPGQGARGAGGFLSGREEGQH